MVAKLILVIVDCRRLMAVFFNSQTKQVNVTFKLLLCEIQCIDINRNSEPLC